MEGVLLFCVGVLGFLLDYFSFLGLQNANSNVGSALLKTDVFFSLFLGSFCIQDQPAAALTRVCCNSGYADRRLIDS